MESVKNKDFFCHDKFIYIGDEGGTDEDNRLHAKMKLFIDNNFDIIEGGFIINVYKSLGKLSEKNNEYMINNNLRKTLGTTGARVLSILCIDMIHFVAIESFRNYGYEKIIKINRKEQEQKDYEYSLRLQSEYENTVKIAQEQEDREFSLRLQSEFENTVKIAQEHEDHEFSLRLQSEYENTVKIAQEQEDHEFSLRLQSEYENTVKIAQEHEDHEISLQLHSRYNS
jgi:hypothetical protein